MKSINHFAVVVAAVVFFMLGAGWYTVLSNAWLAGIGKTMEQLTRRTARLATALHRRLHRDRHHVLHARLWLCQRG